MIEFPCGSRLFDLPFGEESFVVGNSLGKTEVVSAVVVMVNAGLTWRKHNLLAIFCVDMKLLLLFQLSKTTLNLDCRL